MSDLRAVNARLRQVVADKHELIASLERLLAAQRERSQVQDELVKGQGEQIRLQAEQTETQAQLIAGLLDEVAELKRRLGMDSSNSSAPPSKDSVAAKAKRRADRSSRQRSAERKPGGQPGHAGSGLSPTSDPDRTERVAAPVRCRQCHAGLDGAAALAHGWAQVWDLLPVVLATTHYVLPRRRCGCGAATTAPAPFGQAGTVCYGPSLNAAAVLLASEGNVPTERVAMLLQALCGVQVSAGFVARAGQRLADRLARAGLDEAMKTALQAEDVLCGDESPVNVLRNDFDEHGRQVPGAPHAVTLRTPDARLICYAAITSRAKTAIAGLGVLDGWGGLLVRDNYAGWHRLRNALQDRLSRKARTSWARSGIGCPPVFCSSTATPYRERLFPEPGSPSSRTDSPRVSVPTNVAIARSPTTRSRSWYRVSRLGTNRFRRCSSARLMSSGYAVRRRPMLPTSSPETRRTA